MSHSSARGRDANRPTRIPKAGWRDILLRTKQAWSSHHLAVLGAGVAFYGLLALFPALAATISIWGLVFDAEQLQHQIDQLSGYLPQQAAAIVRDQVSQMAAHAGRLGLAAGGGLLLTLYSASKGVKGLIEGLNVVYGEEEKRGFIKLNLVALLLMLVVIIAVLTALGFIIVVPPLLGSLGHGMLGQTLISLVRWPILLVGAMTILAVLYRYGPSRSAPGWRWVSWGAVIATVVWILGSLAFSIYVSRFASYNETYGSIGAVIILLIWLWLSACMVLVGAEINAQMECQTERDSTAGAANSPGYRGARVADGAGEAP